MMKLRNLFMAVAFAMAMMLVPVIASVPVKAAVPENSIEYKGTSPKIVKVDGESEMGMTKAQEGTTIELAGDSVKIHYIPSKTTYSVLHWGMKAEGELSKDVELKDNAFEIELPKEYCGYGVPVVPMKEDGKQASEQYYLGIPAEKYLTLNLTITNNTTMFKVVSAFVKQDEEGTWIYAALSSNGYHYLYKGTYEAAVENGDKRDNWVAGYQNAEGKWEFKIKVEDGENYIPLVAISQSYLEKYEKGENALSRAFFPRQFELNLAAGTLVTDDYEETIDITMTNNVKMFKPASATLTTIGGPNSNGYKVNMNLTMENDSYTAMFVGGKEDAAKEGAEKINLSEGNVFKDVNLLSMEKPGDLDSIKSVLEEPTILSFYSASKETWYERKATISKKNKTIVFDPVDEEEPAKQDDEVKVGTKATVGKSVFKVTSATEAAAVKPVKKTETKVVIPATVKINGKSFKVTSIANNAYKNNKKMKSLVIGKNVKTIGKTAFAGCASLTKIAIPKAVTKIGAGAFQGCKKAKKLVIKGKSIKSFGKKAFAKTGIKKFSAPKKVRKAYRKKAIKAGMKKTVK